MTGISFPNVKGITPMLPRICGVLLLASLSLVVNFSADPADACCPVSHYQLAVANADQTVIIIWDAATQTQHFIRQASFKSEGDDFGFSIPSPSEPGIERIGGRSLSLSLQVDRTGSEKGPVETLASVVAAPPHLI